MKPKNKLMITALAGALLLSPLHSQDGTAQENAAQEKTNAITVRPVAMLLDIFNVNYQHGVGPGNAIASFLYINSLSFGDYTLSAYGIDIGYHYHLNASGPTLKGPYIGPLLSFASVSVSMDYNGLNGTETLTGVGNGLGVGGVIGYQWVWSKFTLALETGYQFSFVGDITVASSDGTVYTFPGGESSGGLLLSFTAGIPF